jgi:hypothetical protein
VRRFTALSTTVMTLAVATAAFAGVAAAGEQLSKKQFLKEGNAICKSANQEIDAVFEQVLGDSTAEPTDEQFAAAAAGAIPIFRTALDDVEGLQGPASLEKQVDKLIGQYRDVADDIEADPASAFSPETDVFAKADKLAKKVGLKTCAQNA